MATNTSLLENLDQRAEHIRTKLKIKPWIKLDTFDREIVAKRLGEQTREICHKTGAQTEQLSAALWPGLVSNPTSLSDLRSRLQRYTIIRDLKGDALGGR